VGLILGTLALVILFVFEFSFALLAVFIGRAVIFIFTAGRVKTGRKRALGEYLKDGETWVGYRFGTHYYVFSNWVGVIGLVVMVALIYLCATLFDWRK
jgi:hypothetical protein